MSILLEKIVSTEHGFNEKEISLFHNAGCATPLFDRYTNHLYWDITFPGIIDADAWIHFRNYLKEALNCEVTLNVAYDDLFASDELIHGYLTVIAEELQLNELKEAAVSLHAPELHLLLAEDEQLSLLNEQKQDIEKAFASYGLNYRLYLDKKAKAVKKVTYNPYSGYTRMNIADISQMVNKVILEGEIFKVDDSVSLRGGRSFGEVEMINYYIKDATGVFLVRYDVRKNELEERLGEFKTGNYIRVYGDVETNKMTQELELHHRLNNPNEIEKIEKPAGRKDTAEVKRIELHAHTKMSEMDGVSSATELINQAYSWGMRAMAVTDHYVVQAFPEAQIAMNKLNKAHPDDPFKVIYGCEMNMIDPQLNIIKNGDGKGLDRSYVVFDLETTGLSNRYDHIIEFGGVKIQSGNIVDRLQLFVKPPVKLAEFTKHLTNIKDSDVENADPIDIALPRIMQFFGDSALVAHNAKFDIGFINAALRKCSQEELSNPYIDTLDLSRALLKERKSYRLGKVASFYKVEYDEDVAHRADYDAEVTAEVFLRMLQSIRQMNYNPNGTMKEDNLILTVDDLENLSDADAFKKVTKKHVTVLAKNQAGIKDLFKLISISHTDYLLFGGKVSTKSDEFMAEPRIPREKISELRENLLIGSACCNGEIFDLASTSSKEALKEAMKFYDFIEVQPPENYRFLIDNHSIADFDRLHTILKDIISCAKELGLPVVATGDVHYTHPDQKILRDVYIQAQGIGGVVHPLYIYNEKARHNSVAPDQHFRTTDEMLECFRFLEDEDLIKEIVITNTNLIADRVEPAYPCKDKLYPPFIDGADENLKALCYKTAHERYGENLPEIVSARLEKELNSIIGNGYGVIYYTAHLMVKDSNDHGYMVGSRGSVGSSFVATMSNITEVNPLPPHYVCKKCHHFELVDNCESGFDLEEKPCPECGDMMKPDGQNIPFETFLGFYGDKVPDIDLNFSSEYQGNAMLYTKTVFGEDKVYRAGTISGVQEKTAYGYIRGYMEKMGIEKLTNAQKTYLAVGCTDVKRTTGQHPGGIIVIPRNMDVHDFTPVQYPANNPESEWKTTHFDFHAIHDNVLKLDNLGHVDPTCMRLLEKISGINVRTIPMNDENVISIFNSTKALKVVDKQYYTEKTGALGLPEFGTRFVRGILNDTRPNVFSQLVRISGLSHGTDVWNNNAKDLVAKGKTLNDVIGCRDDIMTHLIKEGLPPKNSFDIMESVRKGKGLKDEWITLMKENNVPDWYIDSCLKIKYMFPKAHAVAYVMMAMRVAWFKVYYPLYYYISFFTLRCDYFEIGTMIEGKEANYARLKNIQDRLADKNIEVRRGVSNKEEGLVTTLEVANELFCRGFTISNLSLEYSQASEWVLDPDNKKAIIPSFVTIDGLGYNVAKSIGDARNERPFLSKQDLLERTQLSKTLLDKLDELHVLDHLQEENQMSLF